MREMLDAAISAADPGRALERCLPLNRSYPATVVGAGKAAAAMAQALERSWKGPISGTVVVPYGSALPCNCIEVLEASHPLPDENGLRAAAKLIETVENLGSGDHVIALMSGGGSALLPSPPDDLALEDEMELNRRLLASGAPISAMNAIRKQVSMIKGGRLARAASPARVETYVISDVPGDDPVQVASGPTLPDATNRDDALQLMDRYRIELPAKVEGHIRSGAFAAPHPDEQAFAGNSHAVVASSGVSLEAAAEFSRQRGLPAAILSDAVEGEAREAGRLLAAIAREISLRDRPFPKPVVLLSGGETTVTLRGSGKGGRNTEFLLSLALAIEGLEGVTAIAADTDGIDGAGTHAGALACGMTAQRIAERGADPNALLANNDSLAAFEIADDVVSTGPTGTNVNDFRAIVVR